VLLFVDALVWSNEECVFIDFYGDMIRCRCNVLAGFFAVLTAAPFDLGQVISLSSFRTFEIKQHSTELASVALLVPSQYALPGYGDQRVWVRGPGWPDHCVRL